MRPVIPKRDLASNGSRLLFGLAIILGGCNLLKAFPTPGATANPGPAPTITLTPFQPVEAMPATSQGEGVPAAPPVTPTMAPALGSVATWVSPALPAGFQESLALPAEFARAEAAGQAELRLEVGDSNPVSHWVYALVAPFPTIPNGVALRDIRRTWKGEASGPFGGRPLMMDENTRGVFSAWWGEPAPGSVEVLPAEELLERAWQERPSWAIVPFENIKPRWKVLEVDGASPLRKDFDLESYGLVVPISLSGDADTSAILAGAEAWPSTNRDANRLTTVALTGVTALVRATAFTMHRNGITYPAQDIGGLLREADIAHISNEIPFAPDCPPPNPSQEGLRFCSDPDYIALLEEVGTDVVELTGDHFGDWGPDSMLYTLDMYDQRGWIYYGGGRNREDARQARLIEHNGNRIAFIGCNAKGGGYATASETQPGAVACDFDWMHKEIKRLAKQGYQVIATFQHFEYYTYAAQPDQVRDFQGMAEAGTVTVSGSQAHQPQAMEFHAGAFIHYGLGNLFFDQYHFCTDNACDYGFINRHVFYAGRYLGVELIPIIFEDYARPRPMTTEESARLLETVFAASGW